MAHRVSGLGIERADIVNRTFRILGCAGEVRDSLFNPASDIVFIADVGNLGGVFVNVVGYCFFFYL
jgi:hypothetical protein